MSDQKPVPKNVTQDDDSRPSEPDRKVPKWAQRPAGALIRPVSWRQFWHFNSKSTRTHLYWSRPTGPFQQGDAGEDPHQPGTLKTLCGAKFQLDGDGVKYDEEAGRWWCKKCYALAYAKGVKFDSHSGMIIAR